MKKEDALKVLEVLEERFLNEYEKLIEGIEGSLKGDLISMDKRIKSNAITVVIKMIGRYLD